MNIIQGPGPVVVTVICCPHGDELIGQVMFDYYTPIISRHPGLQLIFANQRAHAQNRRFVDTDLNRSFPGSVTGTHEEQLAHAIMPHIAQATYVLDLHTTTADIVMTPIVANLSPNTRRVLNLTSSHEIALMEGTIPHHALIGQVEAGVSLEFNHEYAKTNRAKSEIISIIDHLLTGAQTLPKPRTIFHITGTIPASLPYPTPAANFKPLGTPPVLPFLLGEKAYADSFHAFTAEQTSMQRI